MLRLRIDRCPAHVVLRGFVSLGLRASAFHCSAHATPGVAGRLFACDSAGDFLVKLIGDDAHDFTFTILNWCFIGLARDDLGVLLMRGARDRLLRQLRWNNGHH